jgi:hypothetical protein
LSHVILLTHFLGAQSSRIVLGRPQSKHQEPLKDDIPVKEKIEEYKLFTGEFAIQYDNTKFGIDSHISFEVILILLFVI